MNFTERTVVGMRKLWKAALLLLALLTLGGCMARNADELFAIPRTSEAYEKLQEEVRSVIGNGEGLSPISGSNTQTIQLLDLDQDGTQEAVAFYRDRTQERPLKIAVFKQNQEGDYSLYTQMEGAGSEIESIEYGDLLGGPGLEILVSWQVSSTVHTLVAYSLFDGQAAEVMRSGYTRYLAMDIDGNEKKDVLLIQMDAEDPGQNRVELYIGAEGAMELQSAAPLSGGIGAIQTLEAGRLKDKSPALFATFALGEAYHLTDIFAWTGEALKNLTLTEGSHRSEATLRQNTGVAPTDLNGDGLTEVPRAKTLPIYPSPQPESFWLIDWLQFDKNGVGTRVLTTYHNTTDRWYLEIPEAWNGLFTLSRQEHTEIGEKTLVFSYWNGDLGTPPEAFLVLCRLTGNNREIHAAQDGRFVLWGNSDTIYAAEFKDAQWNCGITQEELIALFHIL